MKINRNDNCPCGSEKKYKHCCGKGNPQNEGNQTLRSFITIAVILFAGITVFGIYDYYQEDRPEMEAYTCDNPNCGKIHYRPVSGSTGDN